MDKNNIDHSINPKNKNAEWIRNYIRNAWNKNAGSIFYSNKGMYETIKSYAYGSQGDSKYRKILKTDEDVDTSWASIDYGILGIVPKFRRVALGKLTKADYNIVATPIDSNAKNEADQYFAKLKAKLMMRQQLAQVDPELAKVPALQPDTKDPQDLEELEMQAEFGFKNLKSIEAEEGIKLMLYQNDIDQARKMVFEDLFDYGVSGYKDWIDENGMVRFRRVDPRNIVSSFCSTGDFKDIQACGEVIEMSMGELRALAGDEFTKEEYETIEGKINGNLYNKSDQKVRVLDLEFFSYNTKVVRRGENKEGNETFKPADYKNKKSDEKSVIGGEEVPKYLSKVIQVVYKGKWIIDTDFIFDYGLATDMKRAKSSKTNTSLSYNLYAPDFYDMRALGIMEQLIPIADQIQIAWYRMQNSMNQAIPKGHEIDLDALENVAIGKGGANMKPLDLLDMFYKKGVIVTRRSGLADGNINYQAVRELENGMGNDVVQYWQIIQNNIDLIRQITGLNEYTDGSSPNPRNNQLNGQSAIESTNNALEYIISGEKTLLEKLSKSIILRLQDSVLKTEVSGYIKSLGTDTIKFIKVSEGIADAEFGIMLEDKPNDQQKAMLQQQIQAAQQNDLLDPTDAILIENTWNLKRASKMLAYKIKRRREQQQQQAMELQQANAQVQIQSSTAAEQAKQATIQLEYKLKMELLEATKTWDYKIKELDVSKQADSDISRATEKIITTAMKQGESGLGYDAAAQLPEEAMEETGYPEEMMEEQVVG